MGNGGMVRIRIEHWVANMEGLINTVSRQCAFSQCPSSLRLIEKTTFNDSDIINNLTDYKDGQEEPDSLIADKNMQGSSFPTN
ncbi:UNVERIFIED_CONTAM: hypothetical protein NCL1_40830 [Trichonephila clavipes]